MSPEFFRNFWGLVPLTSRNLEVETSATTYLTGGCQNCAKRTLDPVDPTRFLSSDIPSAKIYNARSLYSQCSPVFRSLRRQLRPGGATDVCRRPTRGIPRKMVQITMARAFSACATRRPTRDSYRAPTGALYFKTAPPSKRAVVSSPEY